MATQTDSFLGSIFANDVTNYQVPQGNPDTPEKRLMRALLEDAVKCITEVPTTSQKAAQQRLDLEWICSTVVEPFTFEYACWHLGIEAEYFRRLLKGKAKGLRPKVGRREGTYKL